MASRHQYTIQQENTIFELVKKQGSPVRYRHILDVDKEDGKILEGRSNTNIRDKAVNMKMDLLLAGEELEGGWQWVVLSQNAIDKLASHNIRYTRNAPRGYPIEL